MVLLHGSGILSHAFHSYTVFRSFHPFYRVVSLDQRGHGRSDWAAGPEGYTHECFLSDFERFIEALEVERFFLMSASFGARVAMSYIARNPGRVERLVITEGMPETAPHVLAAIRQQAGSPPEVFASIDEAIAARRPSMLSTPPEVLLTLVEYTIKPLPERKVTWTYDLNTRQGQILDEDACISARLWEDYQQIDCPTLVVRGTKSPQFPPNIAFRMARALPCAKLVEIEGAGHGIYWDNPTDYEKALFSFLGVRD